LSGRGLCDELITRPEESYRLCCVVVCDLETSRIGAPYIYIYDISSLRVNGPSEPGRLRDVCVCQWVNQCFVKHSDMLFNLEVAKEIHEIS